MKLLLLHLSDAHFKDKTYIDNSIIESQVQTLNKIGKFDKCCIIFSGDISFSGQINEFKNAKYYLGKLWKLIGKKFEPEYGVSTYVVPGNHDINFDGTSRDRSEVCELKRETISEQQISDELIKFAGFYDFANYYHNFYSNKLVENKIITIENKKVQINLINSELFSICNDTHHDDDKGLHFLPENEWVKLSRTKNADLVVTVSHRGPEWFDWDSCNQFKKKLIEETDIFLYGHEHIDNIDFSCKKENNIIKSIASGIDFLNKKIEFTTISIDLDTQTAETYLFAWNNEENIFEEKQHEKFVIEKINSRFLIEPNSNFLNTILRDNDNYDTRNYFVFPGVEVLNQGKNKEIKDFKEFLKIIEDKKIIAIEGDFSSGKTFLLNQIYINLIGNAVPLLLNDDLLDNKRIDRIIKSAFECQYSSRGVDFEKYQQLDKNYKVLLIDDLTSLKDKYVSALFSYAKESFKRIIYIDQGLNEYDIKQITKESLENDDSIIRVRLLPFYTQKREEYIEKLLLLNDYNPIDVKTNVYNINRFIKDQIKLFSLSPRFIKMYVEYCNHNDMSSSNRNVFGRVFENNIVNSIRRYASENDVDEYSVLLEEIAYEIHFKEKYPLPASDLIDIINNYNSDHSLSVNIKNFIDVMLKSNILIETDNMYSFYNNNYLAYFVAKSLNSRYVNGEGNGELEEISKKICFNINGDILLFLSYITSNMSILKFIRQQAESYLYDWVDLDIDKKNIGFLFKMECPTINNLPTKNEQKAKEEREERFEKEAKLSDKIERKNLYDYNKSDIELEDYKIHQALRFTDLICKILPGFSHRLKADEKTNFVNDIYAFPNKIAFRILRDLDEDFDNITDELFDYLQKYVKDLTKSKVKDALIVSAESLILNLYNNCASKSVSDKTIEILGAHNNESSSAKIQHIMMLENLNRFNEFTSEANLLYDSTNEVLIKSMIKRIIHKHFLYHKELKIIGNVQSVATKYFGASFNKTKLLK